MFIAIKWKYGELRKSEPIQYLKNDQKMINFYKIAKIN